MASSVMFLTYPILSPTPPNPHLLQFHENQQPSGYWKELKKLHFQKTVLISLDWWFQ